MRLPSSHRVAAAASVLFLALLAACTAPTSPPSSPSGATASAPSPTSSPTSAAASPTPAVPSSTPEPAPLRLSVLGDIGSDANAAAVLDAVADRKDDLALVVGDLSYGDPGTERSWCRFVRRHLPPRYPFEIVAGNHDDDGPNGVIDAFTACLPNRLAGVHGDYGRQWYVDLPAKDPVVRVVMVSPGLDFGDGVWSYEAGTAHYTWTRRAVDGARARGVPWVVVGLHMPCLSVGNYGCSMGPDLMNLLLDEQVDLVVTGHEHLYQRTKPLALGSDCPRIRPGRYDAGCVARRGGTTVVTVGTGGIPLREAHLGDPERPYFRVVRAANRHPAHGSLALTVAPDRLTGRFEPVDDGGGADAFVLRH